MIEFKYYCDRCKKEIKPRGGMHVIETPLTRLEDERKRLETIKQLSINFKGQEWQLCNSCSESIRVFLEYPDAKEEDIRGWRGEFH